MPQQNSELMAIQRILGDNIQKDFVRRVVYPNQNPKLPNDDGTVSSHSMAWGTGENGRAYVYPTVVSDGNGGLVRLKENAAWKHAAKTGEFIEFDSEAKANWFSKNYKKVWEQN